MVFRPTTSPHPEPSIFALLKNATRRALLTSQMDDIFRQFKSFREQHTANSKDSTSVFEETSGPASPLGDQHTHAGEKCSLNTTTVAYTILLENYVLSINHAPVPRGFFAGKKAPP